MNVAYNMDCMAAMKKIPDHYFDLAVVDPPYGIGIDGQKLSINKNQKHNRKYHPTKGWDAAPPPDEYFRELERVSKHQIIWGANYFVPAINQRHKGWIVWYKGQQDLTMSDCELAYSSFDTPTRVVIINRGQLQKEGGTIHPTQKPVQLLEWLVKSYSKENDIILDFTAGSMSLAEACINTNRKFICIEKDKHYYEIGINRINSCIIKQ